MHPAVAQGKNLFEKTREFLKNDISNLRTGRVAPSLVEKVKVLAYGVSAELLQLAAISCPEPQTIVIKPWDKNILKDIEKAIIIADLNINPIVDGEIIRLNFPALTEESRRELVKLLHKRLEEARVTLRQQREKIKEQIVNKEKEKAMSADEKFQALKDLDSVVREYNDQIKQIGDNKEQEIMKI